MRYLLSYLLLLLGFTLEARCASIGRRDSGDVNTQDVRKKVFKDLSGRAEDPPEKYFHESTFDCHYDGRFADRKVPYSERKQVLSNLISAYLSTFADLGVETWLMHGSLLGWWWNKKVLPWDTDLDVQVSEESMEFLANYYNMTVYHYQTPRMEQGRDYILEINPHYVIGDRSDSLNVIDARWIDTESGLFIDITAVRKSPDHPAGADMLVCKDGHEFRETYIFPLRDTVFEGHAAKIPFGYATVLAAEYGENALQNTYFENHYFDDSRAEWVPMLQDNQT